MIFKYWVLYGSSIRDFCRYKLPDDTYKQEDILQKVYLALIEATGKGQEIQNPKAWLYKTARNLINTEYTAMQKSREIVSLDAESPLADQLSTDPDYEEERISEEQVEQCFNQVLSSLSREEKDIIEKIYVKNHPIKEVAKEQGRSVNAIQQRLVRLRRKVKKQIHDILDGL